jgi:hypothetical protein
MKSTSFGTTERRPTFVGSVKWRREPLGQAVLNDLERDAVVLDTLDIPRLLVGRDGVRPDIAADGCSRRLGR